MKRPAGTWSIVKGCRTTAMASERSLEIAWSRGPPCADMTAYKSAPWPNLSPANRLKGEPANLPVVSTARVYKWRRESERRGEDARHLVTDPSCCESNFVL